MINFTLKLLFVFMAILLMVGVAIGGVQSAANDFKGFSFFGRFCLFGCTKTTVNPGPTISMRLEEQSWLYSARTTYNFPKMHIKVERGGIIIPDAEVNYNAFVEVTAGVNLDLFSPETDMTHENGIITITLPPPQIIDCILSEEASLNYEHEWCDILGVPLGYTCEHLRDELRDRAREQATNADHSELLELAFLSAKQDVEKLLSGIEGIERLEIVPSTETLPIWAEEGSCIRYANR